MTVPEARNHIIANVFMMAAELLEERGWCQGLPYDNKGRLCLMSAINEASRELIGDDIADKRIRDAVCQILGDKLSEMDGKLWNPATWNDKAGRTKDDVMELLYVLGGAGCIPAAPTLESLGMK